MSLRPRNPTVRAMRLRAGGPHRPRHARQQQNQALRQSLREHWPPPTTPT